MSMPERGTQTSQLRNVIQVLQLGNKSGILTVTHQTTVIEEARITFVHGAMTDVRLGHLSHQKALNAILGWDLCRFVFTTVEINTEPQQRSVNTLPTPDPLPHSTSAQTKHATPPPSQASPTHMPHTPSQEGTNIRPQPSAPIIPRRTRPDVESLQHLTSADLSRLHRRLFLLINEERNLQDLARLLNHSPQEVQKLLHDLAKIGIIML